MCFMLIDFTVENFRSYCTARRFSLSASSSAELPQNVISPHPGHRLLPVAVLYGANASGKTNLLMAMSLLGDLMEAPTSRPLLADFPAFQPFALDKTAQKKPTRFCITFLVDELIYRYEIAFRQKKVEDERLLAYPLGRQQIWFHRTPARIEFNKTHLKGQKQSLEEVTPPGAPFLAVAAAFDHPQLSQPARWLAANLRDRVGAWRPTARRARSPFYELDTTRMLAQNTRFKEWASAFIRYADLGIRDLETEAHAYHLAPDHFTSSVGQTNAALPNEKMVETVYQPYFVHTGESGETARLAIQQESAGTQRLFRLLGPLYDALSKGQLAILDELSESLHPSMVRVLIQLFHDPTRNPHSAQLVFATHDTALLGGKLFRRDQVWLTEKSGTGETDLYSLHDIKGVREDEAIESGYLRGRYGAIPFFSPYDFPPAPQREEEAETADPLSQIAFRPS
jgi:uncharacterized protein